MCFSGSTLDSSSLVPGSIPARLIGGSGKGAGGAAAPHRAWAVAGRTATGGRAHFFSYTACVHMISFAACVRMFSFATLYPPCKLPG